MLTLLLDAMADWPAPIVLVVAAAVLVAESGTLVGIALPGTMLLVALGLWSHAAPGALLPAIAVSAVATVGGGHLGWWRGRSASRPIPARESPDFRGRVVRARATSVRRWLEGRGPAATAALLACGHWASAARPLMPRLAGGAGVPYRTVGPALTLSGTAWAATLVLLGNQVGPHVLTHVGVVPIVLVGLLVVTLTVRARHGATSGEVAP